VIQHERGARGERQRRRTELLELLQRVCGTRVVNHREIDAGDDDVTGAHHAVGVRAENFLSEGVAQ
jgi:hypothetical protein